MIISHKHKFIFIKTLKTAGTSLEIALSKYCGADDIITPIEPEDEEVRRELGYRGPQNCLVPMSRYSIGDFARVLQNRGPIRYTNHVGATFIRKYIDPTLWDSYFKFCFERNPWDRVISGYYFRNPVEPRASIDSFFASGRALTFGSFEQYTRDGLIVADKVYKFEELGDALHDLQQRLGLPETPQMPRTKHKTRVDKRHYRDLLSPEQRDLIAKVHAREIAYFGYEW